MLAHRRKSTARQTQYGAGRDDGHVGHAPSDERTYCELQVI